MPSKRAAGLAETTIKRPKIYRDRVMASFALFDLGAYQMIRYRGILIQRMETGLFRVSVDNHPWNLYLFEQAEEGPFRIASKDARLQDIRLRLATQADRWSRLRHWDPLNALFEADIWSDQKRFAKYIRTCKNCGNKFVSISGRAMTCSHICRQALYRSAHKAASAKANRKR